MPSFSSGAATGAVHIVTAPTYRGLLRMRGTGLFVAAGWFGRFPRACMSLGIVLLVQGETGRFALAGLVAAAFVAGMAVGGPSWSAAMDRIGQARVLTLSLCALTVTSLALVAVVHSGAPQWLWFVIAVLCGVSSADIGSAVRARWVALLDDSGRHAAFSLESVADESVFVVAPPIATVLAASVDPAAGVVVALASGIVGGLVLVLARSTQPDAVPTGRRRTARELLPPVGILPVAIAGIAIGAMFGSFDISAVGWADARGVPGLAGLAIAALGLSTAVGALVYGSIRWRSSPFRRYLAFGSAFAVLIPLLPLSAGSLLLLPATFVVGLVLAPVLIGGFAIAGSRAPEGRTTEVLAYPATGMSIGVTIGATLAGALLDGGGVLGGLTFSACAGVSVVALAAVAEATLRLAKRT
jgi:MFS family permease